MISIDNILIINIMSFHSNSNSIHGSYGGNSLESISGSSHGNPITYNSPNGQTSITPTISHSMNGSHHTVGGGISVNHDFNNTVSGNASVHHHGDNTTGTIGVKIRL